MRYKLKRFVQVQKEKLAAFLITRACALLGWHTVKNETLDYVTKEHVWIVDGCIIGTDRWTDNVIKKLSA
jgi:hypothetical protein